VSFCKRDCQVEEGLATQAEEDDQCRKKVKAYSQVTKNQSAVASSERGFLERVSGMRFLERLRFAR
jgi:hypothetical protein